MNMVRALVVLLALCADVPCQGVDFALLVKGEVKSELKLTIG
jgi:hypothetical protein